jgi:hypothetical protein
MTPDDGHGGCPKHEEFRDEIKFWIFNASSWLFYTKMITTHGHLNINKYCITVTIYTKELSTFKKFIKIVK